MSTVNALKNILIVEDNEADVDILKAAFTELGCTFAVHVEEDGEDGNQIYKKRIQ